MLEKLPDLHGHTLAAVTLFDGLTLAEFTVLSRPWLRAQFPAGYRLSGGAGEVLYVVVAGQVALQDEAGEVLTVLGAGAVLGQMPWVGVQWRGYEAHTAVDSDLYLLSRANVEQMIRTRPWVALNILHHLTAQN